MTLICCICNKKENDNLWTEEFILEENELVSHGYCPHCFAEVMDEIQESIGDIWMDDSCEKQDISAS